MKDIEVKELRKLICATRMEDKNVDIRCLGVDTFVLKEIRHNGMVCHLEQSRE